VYSRNFELEFVNSNTLTNALSDLETNYNDYVPLPETIVKKNNEYTRTLRLSEYNLVKNIIETELDDPAKYLEVLEKTKNVEQFYSLISAGDAKKIKKIIGERAKQVFAKPCAHSEPYEAYMDLYKLTYPWVSTQRDKIRDILMGFLEFDEKSMKYFCNTCGQYVMCQHTFELAGVR
jgi:hypothetical protein